MGRTDPALMQSVFPDEAGVSLRILPADEQSGTAGSAPRHKVATALNRYEYLCSGRKESQTILFNIICSSFIKRDSEAIQEKR